MGGAWVFGKDSKTAPQDQRLSSDLPVTRQKVIVVLGITITSKTAQLVGQALARR